MDTVVTISICVAVVIGIMLVVYNTKIKPIEDKLSGTEVQIIYTISTQLIKPEYLDGVFIEAYGSALEEHYHAEQRLVNKHMQQIYRCIKDHSFALSTIRDSMGKYSVQEKSELLAKAIFLALKIDESKYFTTHLKVPGSRVAENYKDLLQTLGIKNYDVKQALANLQNPPASETALEATAESSEEASARPEAETNQASH